MPTSKKAYALYRQIGGLLRQHPFRPFAIDLTGGKQLIVSDQSLAAILKSYVCVVFRNTNRKVLVPFENIERVVVLGADHGRR